MTQTIPSPKNSQQTIRDTREDATADGNDDISDSETVLDSRFDFEGKEEVRVSMPCAKEYQ